MKATKRAVGKAVSKITNIKENIAKDVTNLLLFAGRKIESNYVASKFISVSKWGIKKSQQVVNATKRKIAQEASKRALKKAKKEAAKAASGKVIKNGLGKVITEMGGAFISKLKWIILGIFALILCAVPIAVGVIGAISSLFLLILFAILIFFATILGFVTSLLSGILGIFGLDNAQVDAYAIEQMYQMEIDWYNDQWDLAAADAKANGYEMYQMVCLDPFTKEIILEDGDKLDASSFMVSNVRDIVSTFDVMQNYYATRYAGYSKEELQELKDSGQVTKDSIILSYEMDDWAKQMIKYTHHGLVAASDVGEGKLVNSYTRVQTTPSTIENNYKNNSLNNLHGYYEMYYSLDEFYHSGATTTYSRNSFFGEPIKIFNPNLGYGEDFAQIPYGCTAGIIYYVRDVYGNYVYEEKLDGEDNIIYPMTSRIVCAGHTIATYYITVDMLTDVDLGQENYDGTVTPNENTDISTLNMTSDFNHSLRLASLRKSALDYSYNNTFGSSNPETKENSEKIALLKLISNWRTRYGILMPRGGTTIPLGGPKAVYTGLSEFSPSVDRSKAVIFKEGYDRLYAEERDRYFKAAFNNEYFNDTMYIVDCSKNIHYQFSNLAFMIDRSSPSWYWDQVKEYYFQEGTDFTPGGITD